MGNLSQEFFQKYVLPDKTKSSSLYKQAKDQRL
jgi:hypothetical protein